MTQLHLDGFADGLATRGKYVSGGAGLGPNTSQNGRVGGWCARNSINWRSPVAGEHATFIIGCALQLQGSGAGTWMRFRSDNGATNHVEIRYTAGGQFQVYRGDGTLLGTTAMAAPLAPLVYRYVEIKAILHDTTGAVTIKVDEVQVLNLTGIDTKNGGTKTVFDWIDFGITGGGEFLADLYVCNGAGTDHNDFLGDIIVETLLPTGNGNSSVLVGSDGNSVNNYLLVNEATPDTTSYVGSAVSGDKDTYAFADLSRAAGTLVAVQTCLYAGKSDAGARTARAVTRRGSTDYAGADVALSTTYTTYAEIAVVDPSTAAAWTIAGVNAAEFGFEVRP